MSLQSAISEQTNFYREQKKKQKGKKKDAYNQSYPQLEHLGERLKGHVQTLQNLISRYALCQTSQIPGEVQ